MVLKTSLGIICLGIWVTILAAFGTVPNSTEPTKLALCAVYYCAFPVKDCGNAKVVTDGNLTDIIEYRLYDTVEYKNRVDSIFLIHRKKNCEVFIPLDTNEFTWLFLPLK
mgnify:CR=1 FL=1